MPLDQVKAAGSDIRTLIARRRPGFSLDAPFYTDPAIFALDMDAIFARHWIFVGVEADVPEAGDYVTVDVGRYSVIVVRDDDGGVRAFHNVCRHRGARLLTEDKGVVGNLVCPYHHWTYGLTGALLHAETTGPGFDPSCYGLKPVALRSLSGLLFICLADQPPADFDEMQRLVEPYLTAHNLRDCKVAATIDLVEPGNWKLTMENNRECYHCGGHPELLCSLFHFFGYSAEDVGPAERPQFERYERTLQEFVDIWESQGLPWRAVELLDGRPTAFRTERLPFDGAGESFTMDAKAASAKPIGAFPSARAGGLHLHTQPNGWFHFLADHAVTFTVLPLDADRTLVRTRWLVHKDAVEGVDYDLDNLTRVWRATNEQDAAFVARAQAGARNPAYEPGPYTPIEYQCDKFCNWYIERLQAYLG